MPRGPAPPAPSTALAGRLVDRTPATLLFGIAAVLLATGTLPVTDGELVLAGLGSALLAALVARLAARPHAIG